MADQTTNSHDDVVHALQLTAGALQCILDENGLDETEVVKFTGRWAHLGALPIGEILNRADAALAPYVGEKA
jgi:hypothetical protein